MKMKMSYAGIATFLFLFVSVFNYGWAAPTNDLIKDIVKEHVGQSGTTITGVGSWTSGQKFVDPVSTMKTKSMQDALKASDFDMTVRVPPGTSDTEALKIWKDTQEKITAKIKSQFSPKEADLILTKTNIYPPDQLVPSALIKNEKEALKHFQKLGAVPSLKYTQKISAMTPKEWKEAAEGLYGEGAKTFRQSYESKKGLTFHKLDVPDPNNPGKTTSKVFQSKLSDLDHWATGHGKYTPQGSAQLASQFRDKTLQYMIEEGKAAQKDFRQTAKNLERLMDERNILLNKVNIQGREDSFIRDVIKNPNLLSNENFQYELIQKLQAVEFENQLLARLGKGTKKEQTLIQSLLNKGGKLIDNLNELYDKIPEGTGKSVGQFLDGLFMGLDLAEAGVALESGDKEGFLKSLALAGISTAGMPPALLASITSAVMDSAKDAGYTFASHQQGCLDLLAGITIEGAEGRGVSALNEMDLLVKFQDAESLRKHIYYQAAQLYSDGSGGNTVSLEIAKGKREALQDRCDKQLVGIWKNLRENMMMKYYAVLDGASYLNHSLELSGRGLTYKGQGDDAVDKYNLPSQSDDKSTNLSARIKFSGVTPEKIKERIREIAVYLPDKLAREHKDKSKKSSDNKPDIFFKTIYRWYLDGTEVAATPDPAYTFSDFSPGRHIIQTSVEISVETKDYDMDKKISLDNIAMVDLMPGFTASISGPSMLEVREKGILFLNIVGGEPPFKLRIVTPENSNLEKTTNERTEDHTYSSATPGGKSIKFIVTDKTNQTKEATHNILIGEGLSAVMYGPKTVKPGEKATFNVNIKGGEPPYGLSIGVSGVNETKDLGAENKNERTFTFDAGKDSGELEFIAIVTDKKGSKFSAKHKIEISGPLSLRVSGPDSLTPGEQIRLGLHIEGGVPPYRFSISGSAVGGESDIGSIDEREGSFAYAAGPKPGTGTIKVVTIDKTGAKASAEYFVKIVDKTNQNSSQQTDVRPQPSLPDNYSRSGSGGGASGIFPKEVWDRMQLQYNISGASLSEPKDATGFTTSRTFKGRLGKGELQVSGTAIYTSPAEYNTSYGSFYAVLEVEVAVGDKREKYNYTQQPGEGPLSKGFSLSIPIPKNAVNGLFNISLTFVNPRYGSRSIEVTGFLEK